MNRSILQLLVVILITMPVAAQPQAPEANQLNNQFETNNYFAERERELRRVNADALSAIDQEYRDALAALGTENASRLQAIMEENSAAHRELRSQGLSSAENAVETNRIQSETQRARAELLVWQQAASQQLQADHQSRRNAQRSAAEQLISSSQELRQETLRRVLEAPVALSTLRVLEFPEEPSNRAATGVIEDSSNGPTVQNGGIDVGNTVPLGSTGDNVTANDSRRQQVNDNLSQAEPATTAQVAQIPQSQINTRLPVDCGPDGYLDADADGAYAAACGGNDCDDNDANRYPGNTEVADASFRDEDCDPTTLGNRDDDGDGYLNPNACNSNGVELICGTDCDDSRASVYPGAPEICNNRDDNCDGDTDEEVLATKFLDRDGDLHGDPGRSYFACPQTTQLPTDGGPVIWLSTHGNDCDDNDPAVWFNCGSGAGN